MPRLKNPKHEKLAQVYVKEVLKDPQITKGEIYHKVYRNVKESSANSQGSLVLKKPEIQLRIQEIIASKNTPEDISADIAELRKATKQVFDPEGNIVEIRDNQTRLGAVQTVLKTMNAFQDQTINDNRTVNFNLNTNSSESNGFLSSLSNAMDKLAGLNDKLAIERTNQ